VDTIKIDRAFVDELDGTGPDLSIVQTILLLAQTLRLDVVAEGIERPAQLAVLARLGCTYGQGFIWSPSMRADAALTWMLAPIRPHDPGSGER
jgi:EAL domain-containing protein (putative c-di-GMP-specific phosphodiesterase class I)